MIMAGEIFYWVLNASILGAAVGLILLIFRRIRALPRFGIYLLWILPLIRFWIPMGLSTKYSLLNIIPRYVTKTVVIWKSTPEYTMMNSIQAAKSYFHIVYTNDLLKNIFNIAGMVWIIAAAAGIRNHQAENYFTRKYRGHYT